MKKKVFGAFAVVWLFLFGLGFVVVQADIDNPAPSQGGGVSFPNPLGENCGDFGCVADRIIGGLYRIAVPIVAIMVLVGGFQILTAGGDPEKFKKGKQTIFYAVIGLVAIILAGGVVGIIQSAFGG